MKPNPRTENRKLTTGNQRTGFFIHKKTNLLQRRGRALHHVCRRDEADGHQEYSASYTEVRQSATAAPLPLAGNGTPKYGHDDVQGHEDRPPDDAAQRPE